MRIVFYEFNNLSRRFTLSPNEVTQKFKEFLREKGYAFVRSNYHNIVPLFVSYGLKSSTDHMTEIKLMLEFTLKEWMKQNSKELNNSNYQS